MIVLNGDEVGAWLDTSWMGGFFLFGSAAGGLQGILGVALCVGARGVCMRKMVGGGSLLVGLMAFEEFFGVAGILV